MATTDALPATIPGALDRAATRFAAQEALVDGDLRLTFAELWEAADEVARALIASGVQAGDRVAVWAPNMAEWAIAALGAHRAGAVLVTLNTRSKGNEAAYVLQRSGARLLFTVTDFLDTDYVALLDRARSLEQEGLLQRPSTWLAYELVVTEVEFWQSSPDRLYRRLRYDLTKFGWAAVRLQP